jgi:hypothetical protein
VVDMELYVPEENQEKVNQIIAKLLELKDQRKHKKNELNLLETKIWKLEDEKRSLYKHRHKWDKIRHDTTNSSYWVCRYCGEFG